MGSLARWDEERLEKEIAETARWVEAELRRLPSSANEARLRQTLQALLEAFCNQCEQLVGLSWSGTAQLDLTTATGRPDAVFYRMVVEYKRPGFLKPDPQHPDNRKAVQQIQGYIQELARGDPATRMGGVVLDGHYLIFLRYWNGRWSVEPPVAANSTSLARMLRWLAYLGGGIALTAENLKDDFSISTERTQDALQAFFQALQRACQISNSMVSQLFEQWRTFFSEAIDYKEAFGGRKLESLKQVAPAEIHSPEEAQQFFFALHTYFALIVKLLAWMALSRHMVARLGAPVFGELASLSGEALRQKLHEMESGGIFRQYGIANLLEGDFFTWYLQAWDASIEKALHPILDRLAAYDPTTLTVHPEETRDLFKKLYHCLLPQAIRHNLGEYYTPDWLAEFVLRQVDPEFFEDDTDEDRLRKKVQTLRWLDPACGSGTFLVLLIRRYRSLGERLMIPEAELLQSILHGVIGLDLNPLAVITARVNYLLALGDLLQHRRSEITIPVYNADSIRLPEARPAYMTYREYVVPLTVGEWAIPESFFVPGRFQEFCSALEEAVDNEWPWEAFWERLYGRIDLQSPEVPHVRPTVQRLYEKLLDLRRQGLDHIWVRILRNAFAPLTVGCFDYVVGNPPWINWEHLPNGYRRSMIPLWKRYGLFSHSGMDTILGKGKKDLSTLMTYVAADKFLKDDGRLGFVITQSVFKTAGAAQGFRRFEIPPDPPADRQPLCVLQVDDMVSLKPFEGASNRTAVVVLQKGKATEYPVRYTVWRRRGKARFTVESSLEEVWSATERLEFHASPVSEEDPTSPWLTLPPGALEAIRKVLGPSKYRAHAGVYTGGANAVYWVTIEERRRDGLVVVSNIIERAKVKVPKVSKAIEPDLLYPLLRGQDVSRWRAEPRRDKAWILMVQDPARRRGRRDLRRRYPRTYAYLKHFEDVLRERAAFKRYFTRKGKATAPFYSMFNVGTYTLKPWKVVWREVAHTLDAAVAPPQDGKPMVPDHTLIAIGCSDSGEAHYLCAVLNSAPVRLAVQAYIVLHPDPHILHYIRVPTFNSQDHPCHGNLARLSEEAHEVAGRGDTEALQEIEAKIDREVARLWDLTDEELQAIWDALRELG